MAIRNGGSCSSPAVAVIVYGGLLFDRVGHGVSGSDSAGYANTARDIVEGRIVLPIEALGKLGLEPKYAAALTPLAQEPGPVPGTTVPYYPPGFPLQLALAGIAAGWDAGPYLLNPVLALMCLVFTYLLARELSLSRPLALAGAAIVGGSTVFILSSLQPLSDVAAATWSTAAVLCALRARRSPAWAAAAGAAFGLAVLVRPTDALLILPLSLALPWRPRPLALFAAAGLPFGVFYGAWNRIAFGSPFRTGYSHQFEAELALSNFGPRVARYGAWILAQLSPLVPLGWLGVAADRRVPGRDRAMLIVWFASIFIFYCFWGPAENWTYGRYFLPCAPALVVGFLLCARDLASRLPNRDVGAPGRRLPYRAIAIALVVGVVLFVEWRVERRLRPFDSGRGQVIYPEACRRLASMAPDGKALVVSMEYSAVLRFYTDLTPVRWDRLGPGDFAILREKARARGYRVLAVVLPHEVSNAAGFAPGPWRFVGDVGIASLWELPAPE